MLVACHSQQGGDIASDVCRRGVHPAAAHSRDFAVGDLLETAERSTYPVARWGRTRSDRMRSVCSMPRGSKMVSQVAIQRLAGHVLDDLPERGKPVVAVRPLRPRLHLHRQAPAVVVRKGRRT